MHNVTVQAQYQQRYSIPDAGNNYTSPIIHHIKLTGLKPNTRQAPWHCGDF